MNPCRRYEELSILFSYQEIGRKKAVTRQKHLSPCGRCQGYLNDLQQVSRIIERHHESPSGLFLDIEQIQRSGIKPNSN